MSVSLIWSAPFSITESFSSNPELLYSASTPSYIVVYALTVYRRIAKLLWMIMIQMNKVSAKKPPKIAREAKVPPARETWRSIEE
jgi:hypothetical protein